MPATKKTISKGNGAGRGGIVPPPDKRFSKTNQPSRKAKSEGKKKYWDRVKLRDLAAVALAEEVVLKVNGGKEVKKLPGTKALILRLKDFVLASDPNKMSMAQIKASALLFDLVVPKEVKVSGDKDNPLAVNLFFDKADKDA